MEQDEVRQRFSQANAARGPDVSGDEVVDAFYALIYENSHFWVVFKETRLYLAPCADLPSLLCPRAFTHQDIAEGYPYINIERYPNELQIRSIPFNCLYAKNKIKLSKFR